jgi:polyhydroxybutyrate depolymerase
MWTLLLGCGGIIDVASDSDVGVDTDVDHSDDPRYDRDNWPAAVGGDRPAKVVYPSHWDDDPLPLVILLHGYGANAAVQDLYFGLSDRVDRGFVLVLPDGLQDSLGARYWNATDACCDLEHSGVDDVAYLTGLIDEIEAKVPIDPDRVVFAGHSNGGFMSYRMACERSDRIAGIAILAGATWLDESRCDGAGPVDVLHMHGTLDAVIPYDGADNFPGAEESVARWAARDGCTGDLRATNTADYEGVIPLDETEGMGFDGDCPVTLWKIRGGTHVPIVNDAWRDAVVDWALSRHK